jgi:hypothetical protein
MGHRSSFAWWLPLAVTLALGCATPPRKLTTRAVDDPAVLPRRLAALSLSGWADRLERTGSWNENLLLNFRYGITDRLELNNLSLRYALLDDAPPPADAPPGTRRPPLSLVFGAGLNGIGYSSLEELFVLPTLSVLVEKHVGARLRLWTALGWDAFWVGTPRQRNTLYTSYLRPNAARTSDVSFAAGASVQLVDHLALTGSVGAHELYACTVPTCDWAARGVSAGVGPAVRPWRWLELVVRAYATERWRPTNPSIPQPAPLIPDVLPPLHVSWYGVSGSATFFW